MEANNATFYYVIRNGPDEGNVQPILAPCRAFADDVMRELMGWSINFNMDKKCSCWSDVEWASAKDRVQGMRSTPIVMLPLVVWRGDEREEPSVRQRLQEVYDRMTRGGWNPQWFVVCVQLPGGAKELITNHSDLVGKVEYYLDKYDEDMCLLSCKEIKLLDFMIV